MANNVYVGSRYVPIFDGEWSSSKTYEPLTIVEYGNSSYTSKKPVPAGTLPTNTTYWALTGNYNGQISNLQTQINTANNNITAIQTRSKRKFLFVGDSYGANPNVSNNWCQVAANAMNLASTQWANLCVNGAKWDSTTNSYLKQIQNYSGDKSTVTDIVVCAGANDVYAANYQTILNKMGDFMTYVKNNYPYAKVWCGWIGFGVNIMGSSDAYKAYEAYKSCGLHGMAYMENLIAANHNYMDLADNDFHPNATANNKIGWAVASILSGGTYDSEMYIGGSWMAGDSSVVTAINGTLTGDFYQHFEEDNIIIDIKRLLLSFSTAVNFNNDVSVDIAKISDLYFRPKNAKMVTPGAIMCAVGSDWKLLYGYFEYTYVSGSGTRLKFHSNNGSLNGVTTAVCSLNIKYPLMMC